MIYGENYVEVYSPVEAYSVDARNSGIISGGGGGSEIVTEGNTFLWQWDPSDDERGGFTGGSWLVGVEGTPLWVMNWTLEDLANHFQTSDNLNDVFRTWQAYVEQHPEDNLVSEFIFAIAGSGGSPDCVISH